MTRKIQITKDCFPFFVYNKKFESEYQTICSAEIKQIAKIPGSYTLQVECGTYVEHMGDRNAVDLVLGQPPRLWAVPPATF